MNCSSKTPFLGLFGDVAVFYREKESKFYRFSALFGTFLHCNPKIPYNGEKVQKTAFFEAFFEINVFSKIFFEKNIGTELNFLSLLKNAPFFRISMTWEKVIVRSRAGTPPGTSLFSLAHKYEDLRPTLQRHV